MVMVVTDMAEVMVTMERDLLRLMLSQDTMVVMVMEVMVVMDMVEDMVTMERDLLMLSQDVMEVMDMAEDMVTMERDLLTLSQDMDMDMDMEEDMVMVVMDMEADTMVKKDRSNFLLKNCYQSNKTKYFSKF